MEIQYKYNHLLFTEESKQCSDSANSIFWEKLDTLQRQNPGATIRVDITVKFERIYNKYCEVLLIQCDEESIQKSALQLYASLYHLVPLDFRQGLDISQIDEKDIYSQ